MARTLRDFDDASFESNDARLVAISDHIRAEGIASAGPVKSALEYATGVVRNGAASDESKSIALRMLWGAVWAHKALRGAKAAAPPPAAAAAAAAAAGDEDDDDDGSGSDDGNGSSSSSSDSEDSNDDDDDDEAAAVHPPMGPTRSHPVVRAAWKHVNRVLARNHAGVRDSVHVRAVRDYTNDARRNGTLEQFADALASLWVIIRATWAQAPDDVVPRASAAPPAFLISRALAKYEMRLAQRQADARREAGESFDHAAARALWYITARGRQTRISLRNHAEFNRTRLDRATPAADITALQEDIAALPLATAGVAQRDPFPFAYILALHRLVTYRRSDGALTCLPIGMPRAVQGDVSAMGGDFFAEIAMNEYIRRSLATDPDVQDMRACVTARVGVPCGLLTGRQVRRWCRVLSREHANPARRYTGFGGPTVVPLVGGVRAAADMRAATETAEDAAERRAILEERYAREFADEEEDVPTHDQALGDLMRSLSDDGVLGAREGVLVAHITRAMIEAVGYGDWRDYCVHQHMVTQWHGLLCAERDRVRHADAQQWMDEAVAAGLAEELRAVADATFALYSVFMAEASARPASDVERFARKGFFDAWLDEIGQAGPLADAFDTLCRRLGWRSADPGAPVAEKVYAMAARYAGAERMLGLRQAAVDQYLNERRPVGAALVSVPVPRDSVAGQIARQNRAAKRAATFAAKLVQASLAGSAPAPGSAVFKAACAQAQGLAGTYRHAMTHDERTAARVMEAGAAVVAMNLAAAQMSQFPDPYDGGGGDGGFEAPFADFQWAAEECDGNAAAANPEPLRRHCVGEEIAAVPAGGPDAPARRYPHVRVVVPSEDFDPVERQVRNANAGGGDDDDDVDRIDYEGRIVNGGFRPVTMEPVRISRTQWGVLSRDRIYRFNRAQVAIVVERLRADAARRALPGRPAIFADRVQFVNPLLPMYAGSRVLFTRASDAWMRLGVSEAWMPQSMFAPPRYAGDPVRVARFDAAGDMEETLAVMPVAAAIQLAEVQNAILHKSAQPTQKQFEQPRGSAGCVLVTFYTREASAVDMHARYTRHRGFYDTDRAAESFLAAEREFDAETGSRRLSARAGDAAAAAAPQTAEEARAARIERERRYYHYCELPGNGDRARYATDATGAGSALTPEEELEAEVARATADHRPLPPRRDPETLFRQSERLVVSHREIWDTDRLIEYLTMHPRALRQKAHTLRHPRVATPGVLLAKRILRQNPDALDPDFQQALEGTANDADVRLVWPFVQKHGGDLTNECDFVPPPREGTPANPVVMPDAEIQRRYMMRADFPPRECLESRGGRVGRRREELAREYALSDPQNDSYFQTHLDANPFDPRLPHVVSETLLDIDGDAAGVAHAGVREHVDALGNRTVVHESKRPEGGVLFRESILGQLQALRRHALAAAELSDASPAGRHIPRVAPIMALDVVMRRTLVVPVADGQTAAEAARAFGHDEAAAVQRAREVFTQALYQNSEDNDVYNDAVASARAALIGAERRLCALLEAHERYVADAWGPIGTQTLTASGPAELYVGAEKLPGAKSVAMDGSVRKNGMPQNRYKEFVLAQFRRPQNEIRRPFFRPPAEQDLQGNVFTRKDRFCLAPDADLLAHADHVKRAAECKNEGIHTPNRARHLVNALRAAIGPVITPAIHEFGSNGESDAARSQRLQFTRDKVAGAANQPVARNARTGHVMRDMVPVGTKGRLARSSAAAAAAAAAASSSSSSSDERDDSDSSGGYDVVYVPGAGAGAAAAAAAADDVSALRRNVGGARFGRDKLISFDRPRWGKIPARRVASPAVWFRYSEESETRRRHWRDEEWWIREDKLAGGDNRAETGLANARRAHAERDTEPLERSLVGLAHALFAAECGEVRTTRRGTTTCLYPLYRHLFRPEDPPAAAAAAAVVPYIDNTQHRDLIGAGARAAAAESPHGFEGRWVRLITEVTSKRRARVIARALKHGSSQAEADAVADDGEMDDDPDYAPPAPSRAHARRDRRKGFKDPYALNVLDPRLAHRGVRIRDVGHLEGDGGGARAPYLLIPSVLDASHTRWTEYSTHPGDAFLWRPVVASRVIALFPVTATGEHTGLDAPQDDPARRAVDVHYEVYVFSPKRFKWDAYYFPPRPGAPLEVFTRDVTLRMNEHADQNYRGRVSFCVLEGVGMEVGTHNNDDRVRDAQREVQAALARQPAPAAANRPYGILDAVVGAVQVPVPAPAGAPAPAFADAMAALVLRHREFRSAAQDDPGAPAAAAASQDFARAATQVSWIQSTHLQRTGALPNGVPLLIPSRHVPPVVLARASDAAAAAVGTVALAHDASRRAADPAREADVRQSVGQFAALCSALEQATGPGAPRQPPTDAGIRSLEDAMRADTAGRVDKGAPVEAPLLVSTEFGPQPALPGTARAVQNHAAGAVRAVVEQRQSVDQFAQVVISGIQFGPPNPADNAAAASAVRAEVTLARNAQQAEDTGALAAQLSAAQGVGAQPALSWDARAVDADSEQLAAQPSLNDRATMELAEQRRGDLASEVINAVSAGQTFDSATRQMEFMHDTAVRARAQLCALMEDADVPLAPLL